MNPFNQKFDYHSLSIKDLVEARDLFHAHLINKDNVIATAIGRYRIRKNESWPYEFEKQKEEKKKKIKEPRTLINSEVRDYSWPCVFVFVSKWRYSKELISGNTIEIIPDSIYLPDGRIVPICVIEAPKKVKSEEYVDTDRIIFPVNYVGGGFPILIESQGQIRLATIGCVVTDGNKYYALTNKHVSGKAGTPIYSKLNGRYKKIGISTELQIGKIPFPEVYKEWKGRDILVNNDIGLIEIEDINIWKTEILNIGELDELANLNTLNMSLSLIPEKSGNPKKRNLRKRLLSFSAVSGFMEGEIIALFYRYRTIGGIEYVSDFLIGGLDGEPLNTHKGDSGSLWMLVGNQKKYYPIAVQWGQHTILSNSGTTDVPYALATNLTNVLVKLDVDIVRGWNTDNDYTWGKIGHFKIGAKSCEIVSNPNLSKLLLANQFNIGYNDDDIINKNMISGIYKVAKEDFVPLADVADIIWKNKRKIPIDKDWISQEGSNHFADIDEKNNQVFNGKSLLELCLDDDKNIDVIKWIEYYSELDKIAPNYDKNDGTLKPRDGALPFRIWQIYDSMIKFLKEKKVSEFVCAGGTLTHYIADACNPLHTSYLHHGRDASEERVHSDFENDMLDKNINALFDGINNYLANGTTFKFDISNGKEATKATIKLIEKAHKILPPETICDIWSKYRGRGKYQKLWEELEQGTTNIIIEGCILMAALWENAWHFGKGDKIYKQELGEIDREVLKALYMDNNFIRSYKINDPKFIEVLL